MTKFLFPENDNTFELIFDKKAEKNNFPLRCEIEPEDE